MAFLLIGQVGIPAITWKKGRTMTVFGSHVVEAGIFCRFTSRTLSLIVEFIAAF